MKLIAIPDGIAVNGIGREGLLFVVHCKGPEAAHRRKLALIKMQDVPIVAAKRLTVGIGDRRRINGIFDGVGTEASKSDSGPAEIVRAVGPDRRQVCAPSRTCYASAHKLCFDLF